MRRPEESAEVKKTGQAGQGPQPSRRGLAIQLVAALAASLACASNAYAIGWGVAATWQLRPAADGSLQLTDGQRAWLHSAMYLGTAFGCLLGGRASARLGPRAVMLYSLLPLAVGQALVGLASSGAVLVVGRLVIGLSSGIPTGLYVSYISGTASPSYRGALTLLSDIICMLGIAGTIALGEVLGWRWLAAVCGAVSVIPTGVLLLLLPDDPVWLLSRGRLGEAKRAAAVFDLDLDVGDTTSLDTDTTAGGWRETLKLLTKRKNLLPLGIVMTLLLFRSFSGYLAILSYSLEFFREAGFQLDAAVCSILFCVIRVLAVLLTSTLVDRLGRRLPLIASCCGVSGCYIGLVTYYQLPILHQYPALPIVLMLGAGFIYSSALACVPFCLVGEMFPLRMRQLGGSLVMFSYGVFSMVSTLAFPRTLAALGASGLFLTHGVIMAAAAVFALLVLPETKGLSLAAIETLFETETPVDKCSGSSDDGGV